MSSPGQYSRIGFATSSLLLLLGDGDLRQVVDEKPVVGHVVGEVGVRPIRSPQHGLGKFFDHPPGEGNDIGVGVLFTVQRAGGR